MVWIGRAAYFALFVALAGLLYWSTPSHDVVRILETDVVRMNEERTNAQGEQTTRTRDVRFINAVTPDGEPAVYRNEDTGWGWPPYLKFDSANLGARAANFVSGQDQPRWVVLTHYGVRLTWFSLFPNVLSVSEADGPDQRVIPWIKIVSILALGVGMLALRRYVLVRFGDGA